jgi:2-iminobutanoate/2-iminopropanoate deaminase
MTRTIITTDKAPKAIGPYSQAVTAGCWVFVAGQLGLDPASGKLVDGGAGSQAERAVANIVAILEAAGTRLDQVVRMTLYLADMAAFGEVNAVLSRHFGDGPPARATIEAGKLPLGALVEIEVQAYLG